MEVPPQTRSHLQNLHAYAGIAILVCATLRLVLRYLQGVPPESETEPRLFRVLARIAHACLYLLLFAMPISGMAAYYLGLDLAGSLHGGLLKAVLWAFIAGHIAGVLMHQFYWRTNILRRMSDGAQVCLRYEFHPDCWRRVWR